MGIDEAVLSTTLGVETDGGTDMTAELFSVNR